MEKPKEGEEHQQQQQHAVANAGVKKKKKEEEGHKKKEKKKMTGDKERELGKAKEARNCGGEPVAVDRSSCEGRGMWRQKRDAASSTSRIGKEEEAEEQEEEREEDGEAEQEQKSKSGIFSIVSDDRGKSSNSSNSSNSNSSNGSSRSRRSSDSSSESNSRGGRDIDRLAINKAFAEVYEQRKRRELLRKNKELLAESSDESSSSSEDEDENAELLSEKVEGKILNVLTKIKNRDASIYDSRVTFFDDEDFPQENENVDAEQASPEDAEEKKKKRKKPTTYTDVVRDTLTRHGAAAYVEEEEAAEEKKVLTHGEEIEALRKAFLDAAQEGENGEEEEKKRKRRRQAGQDDAAAASGDEGEEEEEAEEAGLLRKKKRSAIEREGELQSRITGGKTAAAAAKEPGSADTVLQKYWAADEDLDEDDRFLRDYILNQAWREDRLPCSSAAAAHFPADDAEEEDRICEEQTDLFEATYNFRYEEEERRHEIKGHARRMVGSLRQKSEKRKRQRELKKARKEEEKRRRVEELKRLKNIKKQEIRERLQQIQQVAGLDEIDAKAIDLDADFDPASHDAEMEKLFGGDYEQQEEHVRPKELLKTPKGFEDTLDTAAEANASLEQLTNKRKKLLQLRQKQREKRERKMQRQQLDDGEAYAPLPDGESAGSDSTGAKRHTCEREKDESAAGGGEKGEAGGKMDVAEVGEWWMCDGCGLGIPGGKKRYDCTTCENFTLCRSCFHGVRHPHHLIKKTVPVSCKPPVLEEGSSAVAANTFDELLNEYFQVDYEDVIGGDLPTRFKYTPVAASNYGMSTEEILSKTDKELNAKLSLKKLAPYRDPHLDSKRKIKRSQYRRRMQDESKQGARNKRPVPRDDGQSTVTRFGITKARLDAYTSNK